MAGTPSDDLDDFIIDTFRFSRNDDDELIKVPAGDGLHGYVVVESDSLTHCQIRMLRTGKTWLVDGFIEVWETVRQKPDSNLFPEVLLVGMDEEVAFYLSRFPNGEPVARYAQRQKLPPETVSVLLADFLGLLEQQSVVDLRKHRLSAESIWICWIAGQARLILGDLAPQPDPDAEAKNVGLSVELLRLLANDEENPGFEYLLSAIHPDETNLTELEKSLSGYALEHPQAIGFWSAETRPKPYFTEPVPEILESESEDNDDPIPWYYFVGIGVGLLLMAGCVGLLVRAHQKEQIVVAPPIVERAGPETAVKSDPTWAPQANADIARLRSPVKIKPGEFMEPNEFWLPRDTMQAMTSSGTIPMAESIEFSEPPTLREAFSTTLVIPRSQFDLSEPNEQRLAINDDYRFRPSHQIGGPFSEPAIGSYGFDQLGVRLSRVGFATEESTPFSPSKDEDLTFTPSRLVPEMVWPEARPDEEMVAEEDLAEAIMIRKTGEAIFARKDATDEQKQVAFGHFVRAAELGAPLSHFLIGECLLLGKGGAKDPEKAIWHLEKAVESGEHPAMDLLGVCHVRGWGVATNEKRAVALFQSAIKNGNLPAYYNLGARYAQGQGVPQSETKAAQIFEVGAKKGNAHCMLVYARCFESGFGREKDLQNACYWYQQSAKAKNHEAIRWCSKNGISFQNF